MRDIVIDIKDIKNFQKVQKKKKNICTIFMTYI